MRVEYHWPFEQRAPSDEEASVLSYFYPQQRRPSLLKERQIFEVQAVRGFRGHLLYYVDQDDGCIHPSPHPEFLFKIVDSTVPKDWVGRELLLAAKSPVPDGAWIAPAIWRNGGDSWYEDLIDGVEARVAEYEKIRR